MAESGLARSRRPSTTAVIVVVGAIALAVVAAGLIAPRLLTGPTDAAAGELRIDPAAALLPAVGATRLFTAAIVAADGTSKPVAAAWTSSHPDVVSVDASGLITARALGSAQVTASLDGRTSAPALVVVATAAPGVTLVEDSQVVGEIAETIPGAGPSADATYKITLNGVAPAVGDRLLGTGGAAVAGEVVAVEPSGSSVVATLRLVPLPDLLPDLLVEEQVDLASTPVVVDSEVARLFDVTRSGTHFTFRAKPNFHDLRSQPATSLPRGPFAALGPVAAGVPTPQRLFEDCERDGTLSDEGPAFLPFSLDDGPEFDVDVNPSLDVAWNARTEKRIVFHADPKVESKLGISVNAGFSATWECKQDFVIFRVPVAGPLSFFISGLVPVGIGLEIGGEVTIASAKVSLETTMSATAALGIACFAGKPCALVKDWDGAVDKPKFEYGWSADHGLRFKPSFQAFGFVEADIGNPLLTSLRLEAIEAKIGPKVELDWAPRGVQIADTTYASELKATLELEATAGPDLEGIADRLGIGDIVSTGFEKSVELGRSPTGTLDVSKVSLTAGQPTSASVSLDKEAVTLFGLYDVDKVVLVRASGGSQTELGSVTATEGQTDFEIPFTTPQLLKSSELFAFIVPKLPPGGIVDFELKTAGGSLPIGFACRVPGGVFVTCSVQPDGSGRHSFTTDPPGGIITSWSADGSRVLYATATGNACTQTKLVVARADGSNPVEVGIGGSGRFSPDGSKIAFVRPSCPTGDTLSTATELVVMSADGTNAITIVPASEQPIMPVWSPDGSQIAYIAGGHASLVIVNADGTNRRVVVRSGAIGEPDWSPDGTRFVFVRGRQGANGPTTDLFVVNADGTNERQLTNDEIEEIYPAWSPDGNQIAYSAMFNSKDGSPITFDIQLMTVEGGSVQSVTNDRGVTDETILVWGP